MAFAELGGDIERLLSRESRMFREKGRLDSSVVSLPSSTFTGVSGERAGLCSSASLRSYTRETELL